MKKPRMIKLIWTYTDRNIKDSRLFTLDTIIKESRGLYNLRNFKYRILEYHTDVIYEGMQRERIEAGTLLTDYYAKIISFVTNIDRKAKLEAL